MKVAHPEPSASTVTRRNLALAEKECSDWAGMVFFPVASEIVNHLFQVVVPCLGFPGGTKGYNAERHLGIVGGFSNNVHSYVSSQSFHGQPLSEYILGQTELYTQFRPCPHLPARYPPRP